MNLENIFDYFQIDFHLSREISYNNAILNNVHQPEESFNKNYYH